MTERCGQAIRLAVDERILVVLRWMDCRHTASKLSVWEIPGYMKRDGKCRKESGFLERNSLLMRLIKRTCYCQGATQDAELQLQLPQIRQHPVRHRPDESGRGVLEQNLRRPEPKIHIRNMHKLPLHRILPGRLEQIRQPLRPLHELKILDALSRVARCILLWSCLRFLVEESFCLAPQNTMISC